MTVVHTDLINVRLRQPVDRLERLHGATEAVPSSKARLLRRCIFLALPLLLAGCKVGPKYVKPVVPTYQAPDAYVDQYKEVSSDWKPASPADDRVRGDWWTLFNDPILSNLEIRAAIQNQSLKVYEARFQQARAQITIDKAAEHVNLSTSAYADGVRYSAGRPYFNAPATNNGVADINLPLSINYEVDLWGRIHRMVAQGQEEAQATAADRDDAQLSVQSSLAMYYFDLRSADTLYRLLTDTVTVYQEALRITTNRFNGGVINEADVFQAKAQLQDAIVAQSDAAIERAQYEHAIAILIGQPPNSVTLTPVQLASAPPSAPPQGAGTPESEVPQVHPPVLLTPPAVPVALPSELLERRPDIAAAERRANEANEQIGIARAAYFPTLNLSAAAGIEAAGLPGFFQAGNLIYALGPQVGQTWYDGGRRAGLSAQAYAQFDEQSANYRQTVLTAFQQVEDNLVALRVLAQEAEQQRSATEAAQGAERIFNNRYIGGLDTYLQVVTAQQTTLNNERNDIDIARRRMEAAVLLVKGLGGGWSTAQLPRY